ncbi:RrF2 family transcriptional regulator [Candidatus Latescibacterota bacterium]
MKLSTKGRYGSRAALELAHRYGDGLVMVRQIAERQNLSMRYLEHILNSLRAAGIVKSTRGARGGYELAKHPAKITLGDIVRSLEGSMDIVPCLGDDSCVRKPQCVMFEIWGKVKDAIDNVLDSITLEDMKSRSDEISKSLGLEYSI